MCGPFSLVPPTSRNSVSSTTSTEGQLSRIGPQMSVIIFKHLTAQSFPHISLRILLYTFSIRTYVEGYLYGTVHVTILHIIFIFLSPKVITLFSSSRARFQKEVIASAGIQAYRFSPPDDVFASAEMKKENMCFCPHGPPCAPHGFFNVSLCQLGEYFFY